MFTILAIRRGIVFHQAPIIKQQMIDNQSLRKEYQQKKMTSSADCIKRLSNRYYIVTWFLYLILFTVFELIKIISESIETIFELITTITPTLPSPPIFWVYWLFSPFATSFHITYIIDLCFFIYLIKQFIREISWKSKVSWIKLFVYFLFDYLFCLILTS